MAGGDPTPVTLGSGPITGVHVDADGIRFTARDELVVDFLFDERRIGSFWLIRDTQLEGSERFYAWPGMLRRHLGGHTRLSIVDHLAGTELWSVDARIGDGEERIRVVDAQGNPLGLDKSGRLMRLFDSRSPEHLDPLLDAVEAVVDELERCGVEPFLAYGTLLGAVRSGRLIGHDSDADLAYVSARDHPVDAILGSYRLQRTLMERGYRVTRYSGLAFKIVIEEADGARRGLDVFGGLQRDGRLYLMGEVGTPFRKEWLRPRSEVVLEGRRFPAPAQPEHLLEAMYGPNWRVPDPAFKFTTPVATRRRLNGWFRGGRVGREEIWDQYYHRGHAPKRQPVSAFARWVMDREPDMATAVDVGCGTGRDVVWLARHGVNAWGLDYVAQAYRRLARRTSEQGLPAHYQWANLVDLRSVLVTGARLVREPGPRTVLSRHVADATSAAGRAHLFRLARMVTRGSGRFYLQAVTSPQYGGGAPGVSAVEVDDLVALAHSLGGEVLEHVRLPDNEHEGTVADTEGRRPTISRLVIQWNS